MALQHDIDKKMIYAYLSEVKDPEVPVLSIIDLGIVRDIHWNDDELEVSITPTYNGCPAMDMISTNIRVMLATLGFKKVKIKKILSPAWTTEWMSEEGKRKLKEYGIAPPNPKQQVCDQKYFQANEAVQCPRCNSFHTHRISEFGSTACKSLYQCDDCKEPFDYFKCH
ncbi:MAG TPA: phenylacetate-CoA oxygenase subunit PaaJ [Chitinophagaceae bacterium]|nr:phenylacetate-CoA oxygenase subunit PaaJ [Chitinophagales bacterium]HPG11701.1 phenylacetate-CoA oxygenase subunit PaaJ [Chitinophagaceae bacterium]HRX94782.1 phenylacetate-CoA oxygenase subunit PaaJ [Chitinophagaceae bacterium]